jgi:hypothetical protein
MSIDTNVNKSIDKYVASFVDSTLRGECLILDLNKSYRVRENGNWLAEVDHLVWCKCDPFDGDSLINVNEQIYIPDRLARYLLTVELSISESDGKINFIDTWSESKDDLFLDDLLISDQMLGRICVYSGFLMRDKNDEMDIAVNDFLGSDKLSVKHSQIRSRVMKYLSLI